MKSKKVKIGIITSGVIAALLLVNVFLLPAILQEPVTNTAVQPIGKAGISDLEKESVSHTKVTKANLTTETVTEATTKTSEQMNPNSTHSNVISEVDEVIDYSNNTSNISEDSSNVSRKDESQSSNTDDKTVSSDRFNQEKIELGNEFRKEIKALTAQWLSTVNSLNEPITEDTIKIDQLLSDIGYKYKSTNDKSISGKVMIVMNSIDSSSPGYITLKKDITSSKNEFFKSIVSEYGLASEKITEKLSDATEILYIYVNTLEVADGKYYGASPMTLANAQIGSRILHLNSTSVTQTIVHGEINYSTAAR